MSGKLVYTATYDSIDAFYKDADKALTSGEYSDILRKDWHGVSSKRQLEKLSRNGWDEELDRTTDIAETAVSTVEADIDKMAFSTYHDVSGCEVNIDRYLAGEPENMLEYSPIEVPRNGRVITVCASISISGSVKPNDIKRRGYGIAALVFALQRMGLNTELWADLTASNDGKVIRQRVLVKGANDEADPARIMMGYAHPAMLRGLALPAMHAIPKKYSAPFTAWSYGMPNDPIEDMPEGTIYLPSVRSGKGLPEPEEWLKQKLSALGFIDAN